MNNKLEIGMYVDFDDNGFGTIIKRVKSSTGDAALCTIRRYGAPNEDFYIRYEDDITEANIVATIDGLCEI